MGRRKYDQTCGRICSWNDCTTWQTHGTRWSNHQCGKGTATEKVAAMEAAGIRCANDPSEIGAVLLESLKDANLR